MAEEITYEEWKAQAIAAGAKEEDLPEPWVQDPDDVKVPEEVEY